MLQISLIISLIALAQVKSDKIWNNLKSYKLFVHYIKQKKLVKKYTIK